jgi:hypothetical protein
VTMGSHVPGASSTLPMPVNSLGVIATAPGYGVPVAAPPQSPRTAPERLRPVPLPCRVRRRSRRRCRARKRPWSFPPSQRRSLRSRPQSLPRGARSSSYWRWRSSGSR